LKLSYNKVVSSFAFNFAFFKFNLRRYATGKYIFDPKLDLQWVIGRGFHSSTSHLNLSRFCHSKHNPNTP